MADFGIISKDKYIDIDLKNLDIKKKGMILNAILENSRVLSNANGQPIFSRGGSVKDVINNKSGKRYGSLLWFYLQTENENSLPYIKQAISNSLNNLVFTKQILSFSNLNCEINNRSLTISLNYELESRSQETFKYKFNY